MIIKKKDGNVYVIRGPNKLAEKQSSWESNSLVFHNFNWEKIHYQDFKNKNNKIEIKKENIKVVEYPKIEIPKIQEEYLEQKIEEPEIIEEIPKTEPEVKEPEIVQEIPKIEPEVQETNFPKIKYKVLMHCLPAEKINYKDEFYGDSWSRVRYGVKFIFPSIIIENSDLVLQFWTSDPNQQIKESSIVFPFCYEVYNENTSSYDRVPFDEHRWWKIIKKEEKTGGWLVEAIPSQETPDFSD